jgi:hypothetical protein
VLRNRGSLVSFASARSEGFREAPRLSRKCAKLFDFAREQLSSQIHYDFGMRALKSVLVAAGVALRRFQSSGSSSARTRRDGHDSKGSDVELSRLNEDDVIILCLRQAMLPKFTADDASLFEAILRVREYVSLARLVLISLIASGPVQVSLEDGDFFLCHYVGRIGLRCIATRIRWMLLIMKNILRGALYHSNCFVSTIIQVLSMYAD